jgi:NitT/TauT family transport system substrate-binding protein
MATIDFSKVRERARNGASKLIAVAASAALVATLGLTGCSSGSSDTTSSSASTETVDFALGYLNSTAHVLGFVAQEEGFFAEEGLNVTLTQFSSGTELVSALESEKLDAAFIGSVPTIVQQSNGHDVSIFGGAMSNGHGYVIDSKYTEGLDSWDVTILKGKTVAVPRTTVQELELLQVLTYYGLTYAEDDSADVKLVYFDSQKDAYSALSNAEIDAASCYSPYTALAVDAGYSIVYRCSDEEIFQNQPCCRQVALTSALNSDPEKFEAFERALIKAYAFFQTNQEQTVKDVKEYIDIDDELIDFELYEGYADSNPDPDKQATVSLKNDAVEFGYTNDYDIDSLYNLDIYSAALEAVAAEDPDNTIYQDLQEHFKLYD